MFYDYTITFSQEVDLFWRRRINGASILFFVNRYVALVVYIINIASFAPMTDKVGMNPVWIPSMLTPMLSRGA
ncbi:uncharacterized protein BXZ73DRAFT_44259 [Epithele typhae]|uniref:uncharacterized protein n=1 Tax=Epithele typhae TaxID=378194 RepID=UPI0020079C0C|nr:uncharacterized protein BXZ73DRAFT_44259 [Epithele typhae]KAH9939063.1 hypothetical protein BXZ73DRAFT_44259 [Epithele typhae]